MRAQGSDELSFAWSSDGRCDGETEITVNKGKERESSEPCSAIFCPLGPGFVWLFLMSR